MKILEGLVQGSPEWKAVRAKYPCASEAPVIMGASRHMTRGELLRLKSAGMEKEFSDYVQKMVLDKGHQVEEPARDITERQIGEPLFPATAVSDDDEYLASFDGVTMLEHIVLEHKQWSEELAAAIRAGATEFPDGQEWQMEQQLIVAESAERVIFVCSDGTEERRVQMEYRRVPGRADQLKAGWKQFDHDLEHGDHTPAAPKAVAAPVETLPAVRVQMDGALKVVSNLDKLEPLLRAFIERIPANPSTDQEFADTDAACKALKKVEEELDAAEASALASLDAVEELQRLKKMLHGLARTTRLQREKLVEARKLEIRTEQISRGRQALADCIAGHNTAIGKPCMPLIPADFPARIKGLRTVQSVRDAVDQEIARAKIAAAEIAATITTNMRTLRELASEYIFLFADTATLVLKAPDDCRAVVVSRIAEHKAAEEKRLEAERDRIRKEEEAKAERVQVNLNNLKTYRPSDTESSSWHQERIQALKAEPLTEAIYGGRLEEAKRIHAHLVDDLVEAYQAAAESEAAARQATQAPVAAQPPAVVPSATPASVSQAQNVVSLPTRQAPTSPPTLTLGAISERLGFAVTAQFAKRMGFEGTKVHAATLFHEADVPRLIDSIVAHLRSVQEQLEAA